MIEDIEFHEMRKSIDANGCNAGRMNVDDDEKGGEEEIRIEVLCPKHGIKSEMTRTIIRLTIVINCIGHGSHHILQQNISFN